MEFDVIIVGCGPAGIFAALELTDRTELRVLMLDKGPGIKQREQPERLPQGATGLGPDRAWTGWGGAGAFSDGKLSLSSEGGGWLANYCGQERLERLIEYVDQTYLRYGAPQHLYGTDLDKVDAIAHRTALGLKIVPQKVRHMGTEKCVEILHRMHEHLKDKVEIRIGTEVKCLIVRGNQITGVETTTGEKVGGKCVIVAPGWSGAEWLRSQAEALGLKTVNNPVDVGLRVEVQAPLLEELTQILYEPKLIYHSCEFGNRVRTFCVAPYGEVITESYDDGLVMVNGHSYADRKTQNSNFTILVSTSFTEPFKEPIAYGKYLARLTSLISDGVIIQRLGDLNAGRRSIPERIKHSVTVPSLPSATPGDLSFVLPYRYLADIREMLQALDRVAPGLSSKDTLLYGVEVKFYSSSFELSDVLETAIQNLFTVGDGAGVSRGLVQTSASGVIAAEAAIDRAVQ